jgi:hypothetical protein
MFEEVIFIARLRKGLCVSIWCSKGKVTDHAICWNFSDIFGTRTFRVDTTRTIYVFMGHPLIFFDTSPERKRFS